MKRRYRLIRLRYLLTLLLGLSGSTVWAQEPLIRASVVTNDTIWVGQKVTLVVELLAPGFFSSAASFDLPDPPGLLLMPPSERPIVGGETVSGVYYTVQRHELSAFPQRPGEQTIPPLTARFSFKRAPLDTNEIRAVVKSGPLRFAAAMPAGAEKLRSLISARDLKIEETWSPDPGSTNVVPGNAFTRTIQYSAADMPGMAFPPFPAPAVEGLRIYKKPPVVADQVNRGELLGERRDVLVYLCQRPGTFQLPPVTLTWWNLESKKLETIIFPSRTFTVRGISGHTNSVATSAGDLPSREPWKIAVLVGATVFVAFLAVVFGRKKRLFGWFDCLRPTRLEPLNPADSGPQS